MQTPIEKAFVTILCPSSGMGLKKDARIIQGALNANRISNQIIYIHFGNSYKNIFHRIFTKVKDKLLVLQNKIQLRLGFKRHHISIHLEVVMYKHLFHSNYNVLIPNQEWFRINSLVVEKIDAIWCKSRLAENVFSEIGLPVRYIGFQTQIGSPPDLQSPRKREFFTRIGMTRTRGSDQLVEIWNQHPEWPKLNMVIDDSLKPQLFPDNVNYLEPIKSDNDYFNLVNSFQFHIYVTEAEGFGHSILESMSTGAIVLVTQSAPMTEYATPQSVIFISAEYAGPMCLSPRFKSTNKQIEAAINYCLNMSEDEILQMRHNALKINQQLENAFAQSIKNAIQSSLNT